MSLALWLCPFSEEVTKLASSGATPPATDFRGFGACINPCASISIFALQQFLLCLHLPITAELSPSSPCHGCVLLTHCAQVFPLGTAEALSLQTLDTSARRE